jgi:hypothetical protein
VVFETNGDDDVTAVRGGRVPEVMYAMVAPLMNSALTCGRPA